MAWNDAEKADKKLQWLLDAPKRSQEEFEAYMEREREIDRRCRVRDAIFDVEIRAIKLREENHGKIL